MACANCSSTGGTPNGCGNKGHCSNGGCNRLNTYDWLSKMDIPQIAANSMVEISFKNGARKSFFYLESMIDVVTGDMVVVDTGNGYDVGQITLSGDLVQLQMKKKRVTPERIEHKVIRKANTRDLEKLQEARSLEKDAMIRARKIAQSLGLSMKVGDVEYQGDKRKATFYYTAEDRVDFRELVRAYAQEFKVKIEMRQIGSRQETARIGGIGSCGRELCCSTWLTDFKSVSTSAARYQYMAINQSKLSGQCGRLKCCLNYELDNYMEAISSFPEKANHLKSKYGKASLMKIDIFKGIMYYSVYTDKGRGPIVILDKEDVKEILAMNAKNEFPEDFTSYKIDAPTEEADFQDYSDVTGAVELPDRKRKKRSSRRSKNAKGKPVNKNRGTSKNGGNKPSGKTNSNNKRKETEGHTSRKQQSTPDKNKSSNNQKPKGKRPFRRKNKSNNQGPKTPPKQ